MAYHSSYRIPNTANNFSGLGATDGTSEYNNFGSVEKGLLAQAQHLKGYATKAPLKMPQEDARYQLLMQTGYSGKCPALENLTGDGTPGGAHWASDDGYDKKIKNIMDTYFGPPAEKIKRIIWDPGHHKDSDRGFLGPETEGSNNWLVYAEAKKYFEANFYGTFQSTREVMEDYPDLPQRAMMAWGTPRGRGADLFISYHSNAANGSVRGTEAYIPTAETNRTLAERLTKKVAEVFGHEDRGVKVNDFTVLKVAKAGTYTWKYQDDNEPSSTGQYEPWNLSGGFIQSGTPAQMAILLESGFHDNAEDNAVMTTKRAEIAKAIVDEIVDFFGIPRVENAGTTPDTTTPSTPVIQPPVQKELPVLPPGVPEPAKIEGFGINLYEETETGMSHNRTVLNTVYEADIVENAEGVFECTIKLHNDGRYSSIIFPGMIITAPYLKGREIFRIYNVQEDIAESGDMTIKARHITYDLKDVVIENPVQELGKTFTASQLLGFLAKEKALSHLKFYTDITTKEVYLQDFYLNNAWTYIMAPKTGIKDMFFGFLVRERNLLSIMNDPGRKMGYEARLDKNAMRISKTTDISGLITHLTPYQKYKDEYIKGKTKEAIYAGKYQRQYQAVVQTSVPTQYANGAEVIKASVINMAEVEANNILALGDGEPKVSYSVDIADIDILTGGTYDLKLYDTVRVFEPRFKIDARLKVLQINWDALNERIDSITVGTLKKFRR